MHTTTTTQCSDALEALLNLNEFIDHCEFYPAEEQMEHLINGIVLIDSMMKSLPPELFSDDEQEYVCATQHRIGDALSGIVSEGHHDCQ